MLANGYENDIAGLGSLLGVAEPVSTGWHKPKPVEAENQSVLLMLEPDQHCKELISQGLVLYGYQVNSLSSGEQWPDSMDEIDLVMVRDTLLQDDEARWLSKLRGIPVICFSGAHDFTTRYQLACLGVDACVDEPQDIPALADRIEQLLAEGLATLCPAGILMEIPFSTWRFAGAGT